MTPESKQALRQGVREIFGVDMEKDIPFMDALGHLQTISLARAKIMQVLFDQGVAITANQRARLSQVLEGVFKIQPTAQP